MSSLAYAKRKTEELGVTNIEYMQADILKLTKLDRQFDIIESAGVLHHMNNPMAGWKVLVDCLRDGGLMKIGLYSELARQSVVAMRLEISQSGIGSNDAEMKSLSALSTEMKDLAARARDRKLAPHEYQGGSFAISNLGMMGIDNFDAIVNPPHAGILAVGAGVKKPVVGDDGQVTVATVMSVTMSVDHRVIDGALGAELLKHIVDNLENPMAMLA